MPNIRIKGANKALVQSYATKISELSGLLNCSEDKIFIIDEGLETIYADAKVKNPVYVVVEWKQRRDQEQLMSQHLTQHFKDYSSSVRVTFRDFDNQWYINGIKS
ncbi:hypothetical protein LD125_00621 [Mesoplasma sp. JKS002658]|uniref:DUF1904 family protein n=1 Tax=Mesoplasma whartonense TaxID=2878854 RepID=UPI002022B4A0|nr:MULTISPECIES: DUF1904 family protein [unclassified Mesoplasma]MCL8211659.1 hypothetical protein [Mesoplasma sp. JKS002664]MCL8212398.1 hypothetical protein [Mesoplasma sp. JKS002662]MCL8212762.1 hypothetical protein [Mesoplasma sp. JKS002661]MCL8214357.1 hypothetical protein [Mesoplasma sp. JKS002658]MCL8214938.1 hypothetical protein [Mesoplasma sp. JKS002663]